MATTDTITCPHCSSSLRTAQPFGADSRFRCPACGRSFAVGPPAAAPPSRKWLIFLGVAGAATLLLVGAGAALAVHFLPKRESPPVVAAPAAPDASTIVAPTLPVADAPGSPASSAPSDNNPVKTDLEKHHRNSEPLVLPPDGPPLTPSAAGEPAPQSVLDPKEQEKVNKAIDRGVAWLEKTQLGDGSWSRAHAAGLAALPGLTLLECGVPADDSHVRNAAKFVRREVPKLTATYQLALAILFLDRLGEKEDEPLIRTMALRLMAGQTPAGGWSYECPILKESDEQNLQKILETTRPRSSLDLVTIRSGDKGIDDLITPRSGDHADKPGGTMTLPTEDEVREAKRLYDKLSPSVRDIPALKPPTKDEKMPERDASDGSNTQFGTLGLWAAGRHGVPMERALSLLARRFQVSQTPSGGWGYHYQLHPASGETATMTGAGLLGLAVGHGVTSDLRGADVEAAGEDPRVEKGMKELGRAIGLPEDVHPGKLGAKRQYYLLWSIERVGMLYGRKTIGGKEWYPWGARDLVDSQDEDGSWPQEFPPPTDTCFALLFLKRANLAKDLSTKLQFLTQVKP